MSATPLPTITSVIEQRWFLEPLKGAEHPTSYLDRFPEGVYNTGPDSHLARFLYAILGPSGIGFLRQNALEARLRLEEFGLELFDLDAFYGEPLRFTRITEELYDEDPAGLIDRDAWDTIRARDAQYRARVLDFLDAVRAGNSPLGMHLAARSGLGHEVSIIENYRYLFDERSDDPLGLTYYGKTRFPEEMIVLPRREVPRSEVQTVTIIGGVPTSGTFELIFRGEVTGAIAWDASASNIQTFLEGLKSILPGDVEVTGGPLPDTPIRIRFIGTWSARDVPQIRSQNNTLNNGALIQSNTEVSGVDAADEVAFVSDQDKHHLQEALDRLRSQIIVPTVGEAPGLRARQLWQQAQSTSEYDEVVRYVTGNASVAWPSRDSVSWIEPGIEHGAPKTLQDRQYQYTNYHQVSAVSAFFEDAVSDPNYGDDTTPDIMAANPTNQLGPFNELQVGLFPFLGDQVQQTYLPDMILSDQAEPLTIRNLLENPNTDETVTQLIGGIYPSFYVDLPGVPAVKYDYEQFWASQERAEGSEYVELDLGAVKGLNTVQFEITNKPVDIEIEFELLDQSPRRRFAPVNLETSTSSSLSQSFIPENLNPWSFVEYNFYNDNGELIFARFLRLKFTRRNDPFSPFAAEGVEGEFTFSPWSIDVRNLRTGRKVTNV